MFGTTLRLKALADSVFAGELLHTLHPGIKSGCNVRILMRVPLPSTLSDKPGTVFLQLSCIRQCRPGEMQPLCAHIASGSLTHMPCVQQASTGI